MKIQITVKTPKNQAASCIKSQRVALVGIGKVGLIQEEKILDHNLFCYVVDGNEKEINDIIKRSAGAEVSIKAFYKQLFKWLDRGNKLMHKFKKGEKWVKYWVLKQMKAKKATKEDMASFEAMDIKEFLEITDREEMNLLLSGSLIDIAEIEE